MSRYNVKKDFDIEEEGEEDETEVCLQLTVMEAISPDPTTQLKWPIISRYGLHGNHLVDQNV